MRLLRLPHSLVLLLFTSVFGWAQCAAPSQPGVRICTPVPNSTVVYVFGLFFNSTPAAGGTITGFAVYDNNRKTFQSSGPGQTGVQLFDGSIQNGPHHIVVNVWDSYGHLYQAQENIMVVGQGFPFCAVPSSPGINFCIPPSNAVVSTSIPIGASAKGQTAITNISFFFNGQLISSSDNTASVITAYPVANQGVNYTFTAVATDTSGHKYTATRIAKATYTYGYADCAPKGNQCFPGIVLNAPFDEAFVTDGFQLDTAIQRNPRPITAMRAYINSTLVAQSSGGSLRDTIRNAPSGTHILTIQGWDTAGILYRIQTNLNINVPH